MAKPAFTITTEAIAKPTTTRKIDESYRPIFDHVSQLGEDEAAKIDFPTEAVADAAKGTVQVLANDAGFTIRERRGSRVVSDDGSVTIFLTKRPRQTRGGGGEDSQAVAPVE